MNDPIWYPTQITIPADKITAYLLKDDHPRGGSKARYLKAFGFSTNRPQELADALAAHIQARPRKRRAGDEEGRVIIVLEGPISSPDGRDPWVRTVWKVEPASGTARFVTLIPLSKGRRKT